MKLTDIDILATPCEVHVSTRGYFTVYLRGHADDEGAKPLASEATFDAAVEKAKPQVRQRKTKVAVAYYDLSRSYDQAKALGEQSTWVWTSGLATGIHAGTGNVLAAVNGKSEQLSSYRRIMLYRGDMPKEVRQQIVELRTQADAVSDQMKKLNDEWQFDIAEAVQAAIAEAAA